MSIPSTWPVERIVLPEGAGGWWGPGVLACWMGAPGRILIGRDFAISPDQPAPLDTRWCGDITYIHTWQGWLYLATVIDLASRRVVGWATADHLRTDLVADALTDAVNRRRPAPGVVFHSDRGCQYTSTQYANLAKELGVTLSVGCWGVGSSRGR